MSIQYLNKHKSNLFKLCLVFLCGCYVYSFNPKSSVAHENNDVIDIPVRNDDKQVNIDRCNCSRHLPSPAGKTIDFSSTTCSQHSWARGRGQKVVGFSYYGDSHSVQHKSKGYLQGIKDNLKALPKFYPGWVMRLYYDLPPSDPILEQLCSLACSDQNLDLCYIRDLPGTPIKNAKEIFAMNWRFFPTLDPQVEYFVSRDLDSLFSEREIAAVGAWLESGKAHHMMRDHPQHSINILGSGWGTWLKNRKLRIQWREAWVKAKADAQVMWAARNSVGPDQGFLRRYVWPWAKKDALQHDAYSCKTFPGTVGFPTQRRNATNNFIASVYGQNMYLWEKCPYKCRPKDHKDWEFC